jgi:hypothetical protein
LTQGASGGSPKTGGCGCGASGAPVRLIDIAGAQIGISRLDAILRAVRNANFQDESLEKRELLRLTKAANYVPPGMEAAYLEALWREYRGAS